MAHQYDDPWREDRRLRRHPNAEERRALRSAEIQLFIRQIGRRAQRGVEPNDRSHSREVEGRLKQMNPLEVDRLQWDDEGE